MIRPKETCVRVWLSRRERQVLELHCQALQAKEIAHQLGISTPTVRTHLTSLMAKIGVSSGKELLRWGIRHPDAIATGIVRPGRESEPLKPMPKVA